MLIAVNRNNNANEKQKNAWAAVKTPKKRRKRSMYVTKERLPTASTNAVTEETASTNAVIEENIFQSLADAMPEEPNVNGHSNGQEETQESSSNMQQE
jgi:hypothetical protein